MGLRPALFTARRAHRLGVAVRTCPYLVGLNACGSCATAKIFLDCARPRELIESLQKKVRKGQVSGTGSLFVPTQR